MFSKLSFILLFPCIFQTHSQNLNTLQLVQVIFRHGERTPEYPYPTDPYNAEDFWKEGWGQLTDNGKKQEYELGKYLRNRYQTFISDDYKAKEIYVLSSEKDRTIMSAQLCLAGMFPTSNGTAFDPDLHWQPIPVRTIFESQDNILNCKKKCPRFDSDFEDVLYNSPELREINANNSDLFQYLTEHSGVNVTNINAIDSFYATLMVEELLGLQIPDWAVDVIHTEEFQYMYNLSFALKSSTPLLKRLRTGPLIEQLYSNVQERITNSSMKTKFFMYSAHDTTMVNILNTLEMLELHRPPYASILMIELHKNPDSGKYFLNFIYRNDTTRDPYNLKLPNCEFDCPVESFIQFVIPIIPENWDEECQLSASDSSIFQSTVFYVVAGAIIFVIIACLFWIIARMINKRRRTQRYQEF